MLRNSIIPIAMFCVAVVKAMLTARALEVNALRLGVGGWWLGVGVRDFEVGV